MISKFVNYIKSTYIKKEARKVVVVDQVGLGWHSEEGGDTGGGDNNQVKIGLKVNMKSVFNNLVKKMISDHT